MIDIDKLVVGPELDALVAEKVMGIEVQHCENCDGLNPMDVKPYSTDIAAAWEVVERLKNPRRFTLSNFLDQSRYIAAFGYQEGTGATPAEAICRAALKACGV